MLSTKRRRSASPLPAGSGSNSGKKANTTRSPTEPSKAQRNDEWKQWKQQQSRDYNTHQFLDASATVHAGLFGARRLPEIKSLWRQMVQEELKPPKDTIDEPCDKRTKADEHRSIRRAGESGGGKLSSRHLRRRTNSHKRRRRHRKPRDNTKDAIVNKCPSGGNVKAGGPETRSDMGGVQESQRPCRRARRRPAPMKLSHSHWWKPQPDPLKQAEPSHHWIPTHLWHAKRFHMSPQLFNWSIPLVHSNRGSRASLRLATSDTFPKCTIQDGTWEINGGKIKIEVSGHDTTNSSSQTPMQTLTLMMSRIFGSEASFLNEESVLMGRKTGEGIIHDVDASPLKPIGPATIFFSCDADNSMNRCAHMSLLIHPSIHQRVVSLISTILPAGSSHKLTLSMEPLALLRVRGRSSTMAMNKLFEYQEEDDALNHCSLIKAETPPTLTVSPKMLSQTPLLLKRHCPNQRHQNIPHNLASSGWDILCTPETGCSLFQALVYGGACPIGVVEDARAQLEAYPPLPIFPRDYPDTEEGKSYWGDSVISTDWAVIRSCLEGSWGRINTQLKRTICNWKRQTDREKSEQKGNEKCPSSLDRPRASNTVVKGNSFGRVLAFVNWGSLVSKDAKSPIVVRGSFGIPFIQLLHGFGRLTHSAESRHGRRPRRKVRPTNSIHRASPLSKKESETHSSLCQQLRSSLSLPALLRCELFCEGKGKLVTGDLIFPFQRSDAANGSGETEIPDEVMDALPMGIVVAGGFSPSRGKCHATGFVGAARFVDDLSSSKNGFAMQLPQTNGQKTMTLKVVVAKEGSSGRFGIYALLSIIL
ncbi:hypothetical protein ACHAWF_007432 [Thalassiosira exigua]